MTNQKNHGISSDNLYYTLNNCNSYLFYAVEIALGYGKII